MKIYYLIDMVSGRIYGITGRFLRKFGKNYNGHHNTGGGIKHKGTEVSSRRQARRYGQRGCRSFRYNFWCFTNLQPVAFKPSTPLRKLLPLPQLHTQLYRFPFLPVVGHHRLIGKVIP